MQPDDSFQNALRSPSPVEALRSLVHDLSAEGWRKAEIVRLFERHLERLRDAGQEAQEEIVHEVLDYLTGWCNPHMRLLSDENEKCQVPRPDHS